MAGMPNPYVARELPLIRYLRRVVAPQRRCPAGPTLGLRLVVGGGLGGDLGALCLISKPLGFLTGGKISRFPGLRHGLLRGLLRGLGFLTGLPLNLAFNGVLRP